MLNTCRAETNTKNQYSNIRGYYSIRIRKFVDVIKYSIFSIDYLPFLLNGGLYVTLIKNVKIVYIILTAVYTSLKVN